MSAPATETATGSASGRSLLQHMWSTHLPTITPWLLLLVALAASAYLRGNFFTQYSISSTFATFVPLVLVAAGQAIVIIGGGLDLSIGAIAALASVTTITVMQGEDSRIFLGVLVALGTGIACGALNGLIVAGLRLQPIITTFATASVFSGITLWVLPRPGGRVPSGITSTFRLTAAGIPVTVLIVVLVALTWLLFRRTRFIRNLYAMGGDPAAAYASLVPVRATQAGSYIVAGASAGLAGLGILANSGSGDPFIGGTMALDSVAGVVIGGIALRGGIGTPVGAIVGAMVLSLVTSILFFAGVPSTFRPLAQGLVVIAALALSALSDRRKT
ncbi:MAG TPA: ABC transporter permease [Actinomycetaceae bacterium]|nr:ABC transporter permease [Actinomycetaceae bacterium]